MLIGGILAAVVLVGVVAAAVLRQRSHDDVHSVEHYHRQLHTLEEIRSHPHTGSAENGDDGHSEAAYPASAFNVSGTSTVRLTEPGHIVVPPAPPPPVPNPAKPVLFDDSPADRPADKQADKPDDVSKQGFMAGVDDRAMHSINHRPRRLGGPLAAIAAVVVLIVVLIVAGLHSNGPPRHPTTGRSTTVTTAATRSHPHAGTAHTTGQKKSTTTTAPPAVSGPAATSPNSANYQVADASYTLALAAQKGACWVSATDTSTGAVLFSGTLAAGESHTVAASGPVTVVAGAPAAFAATVNGVPVQLPFGFQAPFTFKFETPASG